MNTMSRLHVIEVIIRVFFEDFGFGGNSEDYYNPCNSLLDKVAIQRKGRLITLLISVSCL